jgi:hypothetical protein
MQALLQQVALKSRFIYEAAYADGIGLLQPRRQRVIEPLRAPDIKGRPTATGSTPPPNPMKTWLP